MDQATFSAFRKVVYDTSGIALGANKEALVCARVAKRMRVLGITDYAAYLDHVLHDHSGEEIVQLINAISTNVTSFFREPDHFEFLAQAMSEWIADGQQRFRLWSSACSTGEEPYSMAITLLEAAGGLAIDARILATDISTRVLAECDRGVYQREKLKDVSPALKSRYFELRDSRGRDAYAVRQDLKRLLLLRRLNLAKPPFPMKGPLDAVFCRNVMIYFDNSSKQSLLSEIHRLLKPGGYLFVGHAETLAGMRSQFKPVRPSIYAK
jgi:chemotaxis protein methyltransferase CheR